MRQTFSHSDFGFPGLGGKPVGEEPEVPRPPEEGGDDGLVLGQLRVQPGSGEEFLSEAESCLITQYFYEVILRGPIWRTSKSDVAMNPFIFLLTHYRPKHSFNVNFGV